MIELLFHTKCVNWKLDELWGHKVVTVISSEFQSKTFIFCLVYSVPIKDSNKFNNIKIK